MSRRLRTRPTTFIFRNLVCFSDSDDDGDSISQCFQKASKRGGGHCSRVVRAVTNGSRDVLFREPLTDERAAAERCCKSRRRRTESEEKKSTKIPLSPKARNYTPAVLCCMRIFLAPCLKKFPFECKRIFTSLLSIAPGQNVSPAPLHPDPGLQN